MLSRIDDGHLVMNKPLEPITQEILNDKWAELESKTEEIGDFYERNVRWNEWLDSVGLKHRVSWEFHWGQCGVLEAIERLCEIIDDPHQYNCFTDPEGTADVLIFLRKPE